MDRVDINERDSNTRRIKNLENSPPTDRGREDATGFFVAFQLGVLHPRRQATQSGSKRTHSAPGDNKNTQRLYTTYKPHTNDPYASPAFF